MRQCKEYGYVVDFEECRMKNIECIFTISYKCLCIVTKENWLILMETYKKHYCYEKKRQSSVWRINLDLMNGDYKQTEYIKLLYKVT